MAVNWTPTPERRRNTAARLSRIFGIPADRLAEDWTMESDGDGAIIRIEMTERISLDEVNAILNGKPPEGNAYLDAHPERRLEFHLPDGRRARAEYRRGTLGVVQSWPVAVALDMERGGHTLTAEEAFHRIVQAMRRVGRAPAGA